MFLGHFGERVGFSGNFVLHARPDDIFEHNGYGPAVQSGDIHCTATQSLGKQRDSIRKSSLEAHILPRGCSLEGKRHQASAAKTLP